MILTGLILASGITPAGILLITPLPAGSDGIGMLGIVDDGLLIDCEGDGFLMATGATDIGTAGLTGRVTDVGSAGLPTATG